MTSSPLLIRASGLPLELFRPAHVDACVARALIRTGDSTVEEFAARLRQQPNARATFRRSILVSVSNRPADGQEFKLLEQTMLPRLLGRSGPVSIWSAGCGDGTELYRVAELLEQHGALEGARLVGSDLQTDNIAAAHANRLRPQSAISRAAIRLEQRDLLADGTPPGRFDLVLCRNVAIYYESRVQEKLHRSLASALHRDGILMLGPSEILPHPERYGLKPLTRHLYSRAGACAA